jgi:hypothetical protein
LATEPLRFWWVRSHLTIYAAKSAPSKSCAFCTLHGTFQRFSAGEAPARRRKNDDGCHASGWNCRPEGLTRPAIGLTNTPEQAASLGGTGIFGSAPKSGMIVTARIPLQQTV